MHEANISIHLLLQGSPQTSHSSTILHFLQILGILGILEILEYVRLSAE